MAVLAIFEEIGVNNELYFIVFGESLLNDGVTVVIYNTIVNLQSLTMALTATDGILIFLSFFTVVFGGLIIGMSCGVLSSFILKHTPHTREIEPIIIVSTAYLGFIFSEILHWSGIISIIGCGIVQKRYSFSNISRKSYTTIKYGVKTCSTISDVVIFLFLGFESVNPDRYDFQVGLILWTLFLCLIIRFIVVFSLSFIINTRRIKPISYKEQFVISYGGLRGAVGFSLANIISENNPHKKMFLTTAMIVIFFTVFIQGSTIKFLVNRFGIRKKDKKDDMINPEIGLKLMDHIMAGVESIAAGISRHSVMEALMLFDDRYIKKFLIRKGVQSKIGFRLEKITLAEHYANLYGPAVLASQRQCYTILNSQTDETDDSSPKPPRVRPFLDDSMDESEKTLSDAFRCHSYEIYKNPKEGHHRDRDLLEQLKRRKLQTSIIRQCLEKNKVESSLIGSDVECDCAVIKTLYEEQKQKFKSA